MPADQFGQELVIRDVRLEDAGHYQCSASNSVGSPVTHVMTLAVDGQSTSMPQPLVSVALLTLGHCQMRDALAR